MKNRILTFKQELEGIIRKCQFCNIAMVDQDNMPYVIPMNFGYEEDTIFMHGSKIGLKNDILHKNPNVCLSFSTDHELRYVNEEIACSWAMRYRSVLIFGKVEIIEDMDEKVRGLNVIMANYSDKKFTYNDPAVIDVQVYKIRVETMEGRAYGY